MSLTEFAEETARRLPEGFYVVLAVDSRWTGVSLRHVDGLELFFDDGETTLEEQVDQAVAKAVELDKSWDR